MKLRWIIAAGAATLLLVGGVWLIASPQGPSEQSVRSSAPAPQTPRQLPAAGAKRAIVAPTIGTPTATQAIITVNTPTTVTVTVQINPVPLAGGVNLLRLGATGTQPIILGVMQSLGTGTYSLQTMFNEPTPGQIQLEVSAAFSGLLRRVISPQLSISVLNSYVDPQTHVQLLYPSGLYPVVGAYEGAFALQSSTSTLAWSGALSNVGGPYTETGFAIIVSTQPYSGVFNIESWVGNEFPTGDVQEIGGFGPVSGVPGYLLQFIGDTDAGGPSILVAKDGTLYTFSYRSSNLTQAQEDSAFSEFQQIVKSTVLP
jgi:hypothetical protein